MSIISSAFSAARRVFQSVSDSTPTLTFGSEMVEVMPGEVGKDTMFVDGGTAEGAEVTVQTLASEWTAAPAKGANVTLAGHATAANGTYQVLRAIYREGTIMFILGNFDAQQ